MFMRVIMSMSEFFGSGKAKIEIYGQQTINYNNNELIK